VLARQRAAQAQRGGEDLAGRPPGGLRDAGRRGIDDLAMLPPMVEMAALAGSGA
jgi:hypothetical protein